MDVGDPSNFVQILELFNQEYERVKDMIEGYSISDAETRKTMTRVFKKSNYVLDPHGAVGYRSLEKYLAANAGSRGIFLETAHPVKFGDTVESAIGGELQIPGSMSYLLKLQKQSKIILPQYQELKDYLNNQ